jgi:hypothetical protein
MVIPVPPAIGPAVAVSPPTIGVSGANVKIGPKELEPDGVETVTK